MPSPATSPILTLIIGDVPPEIATPLQSVIEAVTDIYLADALSGNQRMIDVVHCGVAFRLGESLQPPQLDGLKSIFCNLDSGSIGSAIEISLGDHVSGGERVPAIMQALLSLAEKLGVARNAVAAVWHPASVISGFSYFSETVRDYLSGGAFPVLALVNFKAQEDGTITSTGLGFLSGQELQIGAADMEPAELMRRVVRIVHDIAVNGPIMAATKLSGIEPDEIVEIQPLTESVLVKIGTRVALHA